MAPKLLESAHTRWRGERTLVALIRVGAASKTANSSNDPTNQEATLKPRDTSIHRS